MLLVLKSCLAFDGCLLLTRQWLHSLVCHCFSECNAHTSKKKNKKKKKTARIGFKPLAWGDCNSCTSHNVSIIIKQFKRILVYNFILLHTA